MTIRKAVTQDLQALLNIYNDAVMNSTATFDLHTKNMDEWKEWYSAHNIENHPLYVAELSDGTIAGYASLSGYREKEAYRSTVELSVYVDAHYRRRGIADALMQTLLADARRDNRTHTVVSVITSGNAASVRLHEKFRFTYAGTVREVGFKHGAYQSIDQYYLIVDAT